MTANRLRALALGLFASLLGLASAMPGDAFAEGEAAGRFVLSAQASGTPRGLPPPSLVTISPTGGSAAPSCPAASIGCVTVTNMTDGDLPAPPVTFGQAFAPGDLPKGRGLIALGAAPDGLPVQIDQPARHPDGSLRFAILSVQLPPMAPRASLTLSLADAPISGPTATPLSEADVRAKAQGLQIALLIYASDSWRVKLGDFSGHVAGMPFQAGERLSVQLGADPQDQVSLDVTPELAGGDFESCSKLAEALAARITATGRFKAARPTDTYGELRITARGLPRAFPVTIAYVGAAKTEATKLASYQPPQVLTARLDQIRPNAPKSAVTPWLSGPIATETISRLTFSDELGQPAEPRLAARVALRAHPGSPMITADVAIENDGAFDPSPRRLTYDIAIQNGETTLFSAIGVEHWPQARWHKRVWLKGEPGPFVRHSAAHLIKAGAIPPYDLRIRPSAALADHARKLLASDVFAPMGSGGLTLYMPMTGGRQDIGLLPRWTAAYLLSLAPTDHAVMLGAADGGASAPIHFRDRSTDLPVSLDRHPTASIRPSQSRPADRLAETAPAETPWTVDTSHQPSIAYAPYLLTGDLFYLEELQFWANWNLLATRPEQRGQAAGLIWENQLRGQAWSLRTLGEAAWITPDDHPMKAYFNGKLANNLNWYQQSVVNASGAGGALHWLKSVFNPDEVAPWQNDMMAIVLSQLSRMGWRQADPILSWMADFVIGRWNAEAAGFCPANAAGYWWKSRSAPTARDFTNWGEFSRFNIPAQTACAPLTSIPWRQVPFDYPAIARAALAMMATTGQPGARETYEKVHAIITARWSDDPTWAFVP